MNAEVRTGSIPKIDYLPESKSSRRGWLLAKGLESMIDVSLDALSALFGYDHSFLMVPDEEGKRLFTLGSRASASPGSGSEVWIGEGILGVAAERREVVRTTNFSRGLLYPAPCDPQSSVVARRQPAGAGNRFAWAAGVQSQLVVPLVAQDESARDTLSPKRDVRAGFCPTMSA